MCFSSPRECRCGCQARSPIANTRTATSFDGPDLENLPDLQKAYQVLSTPGIPLPSPLKKWLERRFSSNLDHVRIHVDDAAFEAAWEIHAFAFTYSSHIVFGESHFAPHTWAGLRLLGHELAHVLQQTGPCPEQPLTDTDDLEAEAEAEVAGQRLHLGTLRVDPGFRFRASPRHIIRLGANPGCTDGQRQMIHQSIFDANSWVSKAIRQIEVRPLSSKVLSSLRRNFGSTYGVAANAELIAGRLRRARAEMLRMPMACNSTDTICVDGGNCGFANAGSLSTTICANVTLAPGVTAVFRAGCVLHESFHATFSNFTVDEYSGWHGNSGSTTGYPGTGTQPLLNADSYTTLCMDLS